MTHSPAHDAPTTLLERMTSAGISEARALEHLARGVVRVDGEVVSDPDAVAEGQWVIGAG